jgi:hypothetical protein
MPAVIIFPTSTRCPICHEVFVGIVPRWHYADVHPEYYAWNKAHRRNLYWVLPWPILAIAILFLPLKIDSGLWFLLFAASYVPMLLGLTPEFRMTRKFRREWKAVHPIDPPHYTPPKLAIEGSLFAVLGVIVFATGAFFQGQFLQGLLFLGGILLVASGSVMTIYGRFFGPHKPTIASMGTAAYVGQTRALYAFVPFLLGLLGIVFVGAIVQGQPATVSFPVWSGYFLLWTACEILLFRRLAHSSKKIIRTYVTSDAIPIHREAQWRDEVTSAKEAKNSDLEWCPQCSVAIPRSSTICPHCGEPLKSP